MACMTGSPATMCIATLEKMMHQMVLKPKPIPIAHTATMMSTALMAK